MKKFIIALACIVFGYSYSFAQQKTPAAQKGYYSIGNNAQKLEKPQPVVTSGNHNVGKGYYSINEKARTSKTPVITIGTASPATKGYYSIGDNHRKLGAATVIANAEYATQEYAIH
ncbi:hypothetical protein [Pinibacter aurantiacus]|uniref:Uncharacterized protein n=1 Tax=Pinibacter aurantiacus TaxID=2851599 RepID=A0A9E2S6W9_9BACT|nr:hypothetical protein [Pinibacter aurantiacus]MBV4355829.1 hypothetical protein [Pinibacter aurantiacus]